jgi:hypothetical protein
VACTVAVVRSPCLCEARDSARRGSPPPEARRDDAYLTAGSALVRRRPQLIGRLGARHHSGAQLPRASGHAPPRRTAAIRCCSARRELPLEKLGRSLDSKHLESKHLTARAALVRRRPPVIYWRGTRQHGDLHLPRACGQAPPCRATAIRCRSTQPGRPPVHRPTFVF